MSTSNNRTCVLCGRKYKACRNCEDAASKGLFRWRNSCDTPECFQALMVLNDYYYGKTNKDNARDLLNNVLTEEMKPYDESARMLIEQIYYDDTPSIICEESCNIDHELKEVILDKEAVSNVGVIDQTTDVEATVDCNTYTGKNQDLVLDYIPDEYQQEYEDDSQGDTSHC